MPFGTVHRRATDPNSQKYTQDRPIPRRAVVMVVVRWFVIAMSCSGDEKLQLLATTETP